MNKVLIVVDMQNDFVYGALGTPQAASIVENVRRKVIQARANNHIIIFTKDIHYKEDYNTLVEGAFVPPHCMASENGHWIIEELKPYIEYMAVKSTYGYQEWDNWEEFFKEADVIELCGVCTDICVISNALILRSMYPTIPIIVDASCCAGVTVAKHRAALGVMKSCNIEVINDETTAF